MAVKIRTPFPLPINGLLPKVPPIGLNISASVRLREQQIEVLWNTPDFNRRCAISGSIVKLFYSYNTLYIICKGFIYAFQKIPLWRFPYDLIYDLPQTGKFVFCSCKLRLLPTAQKFVVKRTID